MNKLLSILGLLTATVVHELDAQSDLTEAEQTCHTFLTQEWKNMVGPECYREGQVESGWLWGIDLPYHCEQEPDCFPKRKDAMETFTTRCASLDLRVYTEDGEGHEELSLRRQLATTAAYIDLYHYLAQVGCKRLPSGELCHDFGKRHRNDLIHANATRSIQCHTCLQEEGLGGLKIYAKYYNHSSQPDATELNSIHSYLANCSMELVKDISAQSESNARSFLWTSFQVLALGLNMYYLTV
jgi:hypothetical protein